MADHLFTITGTEGGETFPAIGFSTIAGAGRVFTVTATPMEGYRFDHWELNGQNYTENPVNVYINNDFESFVLHVVFTRISVSTKILAPVFVAIALIGLGVYVLTRKKKA